MNRFFLLFEQWELAEIAAVRAECRLARRLDAYCEGWSHAPSVQEIGEAQRLRAGAFDLMAAMRTLLASERRTAAVL